MDNKQQYKHGYLYNVTQNIVKYYGVPPVTAIHENGNIWII